MFVSKILSLKKKNIIKAFIFLYFFTFVYGSKLSFVQLKRIQQNYQTAIISFFFFLHFPNNSVNTIPNV